MTHNPKIVGLDPAIGREKKGTKWVECWCGCALVVQRLNTRLIILTLALGERKWQKGLIVCVVVSFSHSGRMINL